MICLAKPQAKKGHSECSVCLECILSLIEQVHLVTPRRVEPHEQDETGAFYIKDCAQAIQVLQTADKLSHRIYNIRRRATHQL